MTKKQVAKTDYSKLTLNDVIKRKLRRSSSFLELKEEEQKEVARYIQAHHIDIRLFDYKWYDIITNKFYAREFVTDGENNNVQVEKREFENFTAFFDYVRGDIYQGTCFYGYSFSDAEIKKYSINLSSLNFDSFIKETIDDYTFEYINSLEKKNDDVNLNRASSILKWFRRSKPVITLKDLEKKYKQFTKKYNFRGVNHVFFSMLLMRDKSIMKDAAIQFACKHDGYEGLSFDKILLTYGRAAAVYVINNYEGDFLSYNTKRKRIRGFIDSLAGFDNGTFKLKREICFDSDLQLYIVRDTYSNNVNTPIYNENYFGTFNELVAFTNGDLSGADLSKAPILKRDVLNYKTNEETKFPLPKNYSSYQLEKIYSEGKFTVSQRWLDEDGAVILKKEHIFHIFFDFVHFLKGDLSGIDFLLCEGIGNIKGLKGLKLDGIRVTSKIANQLGLPIKPLPKGRFEVDTFEETNKFELQTMDNLLLEHPEEDDYSPRISYITDIHLLHRLQAFHCKTANDVAYVIKSIAKTICEQATYITLIGGDTSSDYRVFKFFLENLDEFHSKGNFFFTLGNHELWRQKNTTFESILEKYQRLFKNIGNECFHLIQNNLFYNELGVWTEISEEELIEISKEDLRGRMRGASIIIFGGMGFAGENDVFNATVGIYESVVDRMKEKSESAKFLKLYEKVTEALKGKNLIVLTHMPMKDWGGKDIHAKEGVVYVNGHNHRNYFYDDGKKRIFADNQVGYHGRRLSLKQIPMDFGFDWFADYEDGIYEITRDDYENFYRGIGNWLTFNRKYKKLYLIKREGTYMFLMQNQKGRLLILNGGAVKKVDNHSLGYFYDNIVKYSKSVSMFLSKYNAFQKKIASEIKNIGGYGRIHGCIVDIDFFNHLYLNPLDGSITPYFAYSIVDKYVYKNIPSLLKEKCPNLFSNYLKLINGHQRENNLIIYDKNIPITQKKVYVDSTEMYKISRIIKGLQFTVKYNIVRLWNDEIISNASEKNGKLIVATIIHPDL